MLLLIRNAQFVVITIFILVFFSGATSSRAENPAESFLQTTYLINIQENLRFSQTILRLGLGGFELAQGEFRRFGPWYDPKWTDLRFEFMTQVNDQFGLLWAVSTGERGEKYRVDPEFRAGFILQFEPLSHVYMSFLYTRSFGGALRELPCQADYGEIGGMRQVNCRLAASTLTPEETLQYLVNIKPAGQNWFGLRMRVPLDVKRQKGVLP